jgi:AcrR family transcriptional regulator
MVEFARQLTARQHSILDAALRRFIHCGYRRTSMDDVAREAELSRTALYQHFTNKEEIFRALAADLYRRALIAADDAAKANDTFEERLFRVLDAKMGFFYNLLRGSEHGREMLDDGNRLCGDLTKQAGQRNQQILARVIRDGATRGAFSLQRVGLAPGSSAQFLIDCADGLVGRQGSLPRHSKPPALVFRVPTSRDGRPAQMLGATSTSERDHNSAARTGSVA